MNPFVRVIEALNASGARYVIVGGFAAVLHGNNRVTTDLDVVIDLEPAKATQVLESLLGLGFKSRLPVDPLSFADARQRQEWVETKNLQVFTLLDPQNPAFAVDIFARSPVAFDELYARSVVLTIQGHRTRVCSLIDLIDMKLKAGRAQDVLDVENLRLIQARKAKP